MIKFLTHFFGAKNGTIVITQWPNTPMWIAIMFYLGKNIPVTLIQTACEVGFIGALIYWAFLEITTGVNTWRKFLGVMTVGYLLLRIIT